MTYRLALAVAGSAALFAAGCAHAPNRASACDRDCLIGVADAYLAAIAAHDPAAAPLASDLAFVENITRMSPGEGLWASSAGPATDFRIVVPDPVAGAVGMITVMDQQTADGVAPALLALRLQVENGQITEAEHVIGAAPLVEGDTHMDVARPGFAEAVDTSDRLSRAELVTIAGGYYGALNQNDGSLARFAADCERHENGVLTASPDLPPAPFDAVDVNGNAPPPVVEDCAGQMSSGRYAYVDDLLNRRVFAADPVQGLAMGLSQFTASMAHGANPLTAADGTVVMWEEDREPYDLPAAHVFKITDGEIHLIEAIGFFTAYGSPTGWE